MRVRVTYSSSWVGCHLISKVDIWETTCFCWGNLSGEPLEPVTRNPVRLQDAEMKWRLQTDYSGSSCSPLTRGLLSERLTGRRLLGWIVYWSYTWQRKFKATNVMKCVNTCNNKMLNLEICLFLMWFRAFDININHELLSLTAAYGLNPEENVLRSHLHVLLFSLHANEVMWLVIGLTVC